MGINLLIIFEFNEFSVELVDTKIKQVKVARISKEIFNAAFSGARVDHTLLLVM